MPNSALIATINTGALARNAATLRRASGGQRIWAVVKAQAYGHGVELCTRALQAHVDGFAVARTEEGLHLRSVGVDAPILVLGGPFSADEVAEYAEHGLQMVVHDDAQLTWLREAPVSHEVRIWVKIDSGMSRLGFPPERAVSVWKFLHGLPYVVDYPGLMTHLANADNPADPYSDTQVRRFQDAVASLSAPKSIANSAGLLAWPQSRADWARPGLALYGISPFADGDARDLGLEPVMTLCTQLIASKWVHAGMPVGYGGRWQCPEDMPVGVAAIGYADGYPRDMPSGAPVLVDGVRASVIGPVSMDLLAIDLRTVPNARTGAKVTLWGGGLPVEEVARAAGRIPYELVAGLGTRIVREPS
ncbi:MAG: alanine racemase [Gammaproteobacteria bacterium]|jgi:alanine racemase